MKNDVNERILMYANLKQPFLPQKHIMNTPNHIKIQL